MAWQTYFEQDVRDVRPLIGQLATIDADGRPQCRSIVCRGFESDGRLLFTSDARSRKNHQLRAAPMAEVCFWLADQRLQWRLFGQCGIETAGDRYEKCWREMSGSARALFTWPPSGAPRDADDAFIDTVGQDTPPPSTYELLVFKPADADRLDLSTTPHGRRIWAAPDWLGVDVNP